MLLQVSILESLGVACPLDAVFFLSVMTQTDSQDQGVSMSWWLGRWLGAKKVLDEANNFCEGNSAMRTEKETLDVYVRVYSCVLRRPG